MGFYELSSSSENDNQDLPWLNEYIELSEFDLTGSVYSVSTVKKTKTGFVLDCDCFIAWVWKKSKMGESLSTGLGECTQTETYPQLALMIKPKLKNGFTIGFLDDSFASYKWSGEENIFTLHPQKNLPLDVSPYIDDSTQAQAPSGNGRKQPEKQPKTSATSSKAESSQ